MRRFRQAKSKPSRIGWTLERPKAIPKLAPAARAFLDGWNIGQPDMVVEMPAAYQIPARGTVEYTYIIIPTNFKDRCLGAGAWKFVHRTEHMCITRSLRAPGGSNGSGISCRRPVRAGAA